MCMRHAHVVNTFALGNKLLGAICDRLRNYVQLAIFKGIED